MLLPYGQIGSGQLHFLQGAEMSKNKLGLLTFGLVLLGFVLFVKTGSFLLFALLILSAALLVFSKNTFTK